MTDISPMSRDEKLLRKLLGQSIETEPPKSRIELLLKQIIDEGGVGGGSYKIRDEYATLADLEAAHPTGEAGDAYLVGDPTHIYIWLTDSQQYADGGLFAAVPGEDGNGIVSIEKTSTSGLVDTYTITFTDGDTDTFTVTNGAEGAGITDISKTSTVGNVDTYTITLSNGDTYDFTVTNGGGVPSGGTTGQILAKKSDADGDVEWIPNEGGSDVSSELASLSAAASELASETGSLSAENSTQTSEISSLSAENSAQASELGSLSSENSSQSSELSSLSSENSAQSSELSSLSATMSEVVSEISSMSVSDIASELSSLTSENSTQESEIGSLAAVDSAHTSELSSLSQSMSEIASAAASTSAAQSEIDNTQDSSLASLSTENSTAASELASLSTENSTQTSEIDSLSTAASEMGSELDVLGSEVADKQDALVEGPGIDIDAQTNEIKTEMVLFTGSHDAWNALTTAQKKTYTHAAFNDDEGTGLVDLAPTEDSNNLVTSGGVYAFAKEKEIEAEALHANVSSIEAEARLDETNKIVSINMRFQVSAEIAQATGLITIKTGKALTQNAKYGFGTIVNDAGTSYSAYVSFHEANMILRCRSALPATNYQFEGVFPY